jgi:hypothetical protein
MTTQTELIERVTIVGTLEEIAEERVRLTAEGWTVSRCGGGTKLWTLRAERSHVYLIET